MQNQNSLVNKNIDTEKGKSKHNRYHLYLKHNLYCLKSRSLERNGLGLTGAYARNKTSLNLTMVLEGRVI